MRRRLRELLKTQNNRRERKEEGEERKRGKNQTKIKKRKKIGMRGSLRELLKT